MGNCPDPVDNRGMALGVVRLEGRETQEVTIIPHLNRQFDDGHLLPGPDADDEKVIIQQNRPP